MYLEPAALVDEALALSGSRSFTADETGREGINQSKVLRRHDATCDRAVTEKTRQEAQTIKATQSAKDLHASAREAKLMREGKSCSRGREEKSENKGHCCFKARICGPSSIERWLKSVFIRRAERGGGGKGEMRSRRRVDRPHVRSLRSGITVSIEESAARIVYSSTKDGKQHNDIV